MQPWLTSNFMPLKVKIRYPWISGSQIEDTLLVLPCPYILWWFHQESLNRYELQIFIDFPKLCSLEFELNLHRNQRNQWEKDNHRCLCHILRIFYRLRYLKHNCFSQHISGDIFCIVSSTYIQMCCTLWIFSIKLV